MRLVLTLTLVLLATSVFAGEPVKPADVKIDEVSALRLEKVDLALQAVLAEIGRLQERGERIKEQAVGFVADCAERTPMLTGVVDGAMSDGSGSGRGSKIS